ncbi:MAG TPA: ATP-dependent helicase, partial [Cryptosporangiaceae bacterium]|nr:ATP-dependent helicase [Cryptosporangiaceae bacterium]
MRYSAGRLAELLGLPPLTAQQVEIIEAPMVPMLVVAGAGSGKTETMAARVVWLVANGHVGPDEVLGLTFTRKAAAELSARIRGRVAQLRHRLAADPGGDGGEPAVATYNAYAARIVSEHGLRSGFEPSARLLTEAVTWQLADAVVRAYDGDMSAVDNAPSTVTAAVLDLAGQLAEHLRTPAELAAWTERFVAGVEALPPGPGRGRQALLYAGVRDLLAVQRARAQLIPMVERYAERKRRAEAIDFGDQMSRAAIVARDHPEVGRVERARYRVVLLDEYQDTSHAQLVLLTSLFGAGHPVTAVGDPCQSIYAWRGASAGNLARFPRHFPHADEAPAQVAALSVSWRNRAEVLDLANVLSAPLRAAGGQVEVPELRPGHAGAATVACALLATGEDEAGWVARRIAAAWRSGGDSPPTVAVLLRKRDHFDRVATALRAEGLPVEVVGLGGLLDTPEIRDVVATLRVLVEPTAGPALLRLLTGARWRLGPYDLAALARRASILAASDHDAVVAEAADGRSIVEALDDLGPADAYSGEGYARLTRLRDEVRGLRARSRQPLPELVADIERTLGLDIEVASRPGNDQALARGHLDAFGDVAAEFSETAEQPGVSAFLAFLDAAEEQERGLAPGQVSVVQGAVQVLTVHAAKGLEWDVVAVPGLTAGVFPIPGTVTDTWAKGLGALPFPLRGDAADLPALDLSAAGDQCDAENARKAFEGAWKLRALAEERRLAYVAVTRARHTLLCSGCWWEPDTVKAKGPSVFLSEVEAHCAAGGGTVDLWTEAPGPEDANPLAAAATR